MYAMRALLAIIACLVFVVILMGMTSGMQSYATAQQAEAIREQARAMQEIARIGQINATTNLISILTLTLVIVIGVIMAAAVLWILYKRSIRSAYHPTALSRPVHESLPKEQDPLDQILELEKLKLLRELRGSNQLPMNDNQPAQQPENDPLHWLR
jgi:hypothetical protein